MIDLGNQWRTFEFQGRKFLYHREGIGQSATETITELVDYDKLR